MADFTLKGYEILDMIHTGANSDVYKAQDVKTGETVAIKHISEEKLRSDKLFRHIRSEYRIGRVLRKNPGGHPPPPGILLVHELRARRRPIAIRGFDMVMEFVDGENLDDLKGFEVHELARIYYRAAKALRFMHIRGYIHADFKPSNIMVTRSLDVKLIDFGLSCKTNSSFKSARGTPDYMAPEQVERRRIDERTDIYNVGATFYRLLTGQCLPPLMPAIGVSPDERFMAERNGQASPVRELNPNVPPGFANIVAKSCQRRKRHRIQTMQSVITGLESVYPNLPRLQ